MVSYKIEITYADTTVEECSIENDELTWTNPPGKITLGNRAKLQNIIVLLNRLLKESQVTKFNIETTA